MDKEQTFQRLGVDFDKYITKDRLVTEQTRRRVNVGCCFSLTSWPHTLCHDSG